ncbi:MAG TPA: hypothetical protein VNO79_06810, partial [Actinomycetota bacterium]|nr:hypothetical protein [Actinomycetota bacterium]
VARRCGVIRTGAVERRTTLLLLRYRFDVTTRARRGEPHAQLAEDAGLLAFEGPPEDPTWLPPERAEALLEAAPAANVAPEQARDLVGRVVEGIDHLTPRLEEAARRRAEEIREAHERVRRAARATGVRTTVEPKLPVDALGVYVLLPGVKT